MNNLIIRVMNRKLQVAQTFYPEYTRWDSGVEEEEYEFPVDRSKLP